MKAQKVKLFKIPSKSRSYHYDDDYENRRLMSAGVDWWEVEKEELGELQEAVNNANQSTKRVYDYLLVYHVSEDEVSDLYDSAKAFIEERRKIQEKREKELKERKEKSKAASIAKKKKQLEKLQKELGIKE